MNGPGKDGCQRERFRRAYLQAREMRISKEAFGEGIGLSVSAVLQKISGEEVASHAHTTEEQAQHAELLVRRIAEELGRELPEVEEMTSKPPTTPTPMPVVPAAETAVAVGIAGTVAAATKVKSKIVSAKTQSKRFLSQIEVHPDVFDPEKYIGVEIQKNGEVLARILAKPVYNQAEKRWEALAEVAGMLAIIEVSFYQFG